MQPVDDLRNYTGEREKVKEREGGLHFHWRL